MQGSCMFIYIGQSEAAFRQDDLVNNQLSVLHVEDFHTGTVTVDEDKNITTADIFTHHIVYQSAQGVEATPHIGGIGIQIVVHRGSQV